MMARFRATDKGDIPFTPEEEAARNAEEAAVKAAEPARAMAGLRRERNALLAKCDWTQYNDTPLDSEAKTEWAVYRQLLRDLPENTDPTDPTWPEAPE